MKSSSSLQNAATCLRTAIRWKQRRQESGPGGLGERQVAALFHTADDCLGDTHSPTGFSADLCGFGRDETVAHDGTHQSPYLAAHNGCRMLACPPHAEQSLPVRSADRAWEM